MKKAYTPQKIVLMMAEDDDDDYFLASKALKEAQILNPVVRVRNGEELIHYLHGKGVYSDRDKYPYPGLIFLDLNMPKVDGREALAVIRKDDELKKIPVVILTTSKSEEDIISTYALGSNSFIRKPVTFDHFVNTMRTIGSYWLELVDLPPTKE